MRHTAPGPICTGYRSELCMQSMSWCRIIAFSGNLVVQDVRDTTFPPFTLEHILIDEGDGFTMACQVLLSNTIAPSPPHPSNQLLTRLQQCQINFEICCTASGTSARCRHCAMQAGTVCWIFTIVEIPCEVAVETPIDLQPLTVGHLAWHLLCPHLLAKAPGFCWAQHLSEPMQPMWAAEVDQQHTKSAIVWSMKAMRSVMPTGNEPEETFIVALLAFAAPFADYDAPEKHLRASALWAPGTCRCHHSQQRASNSPIIHTTMH